MKKLQCELCGSVDIIKKDNDTFQCQHCGCKYSTEQARMLISGVVEYTKGNAELTRLLNNAETQLELNNTNAALKIYNDLSNEYPAEYQVWNGFLNLLYTECLKKKNLIAFSRGIGISLEKVQNSAMAICPSSKQTDLKQIIDNFWNTVYNDTLSGSFSLFIVDSSEVYWRFEEHLKWLSSCHPLMKQLIDEGITIAKHMNEMEIHYGYPTSYRKGKISFWSNHLDDGIGFSKMWLAVGNICICHGKHQLDDYTNTNVMTMPVFATDTSNFYDTIKQIAITNIESLTICPFCSEGRIKKRLFGGKVCSSCGKQLIS